MPVYKKKKIFIYMDEKQSDKMPTLSMQGPNGPLKIADDVNERLYDLLFAPMKHVKRKVSSKSCTTRV